MANCEEDDQLKLSNLHKIGDTLSDWFQVSLEYIDLAVISKQEVSRQLARVMVLMAGPCRGATRNIVCKF